MTDTPDAGHTFRLSVCSRGSYGLIGTAGRTDAEEFMGPAFVLDVRAWNLSAALRAAAKVRLDTWRLEPSVVDLQEALDELWSEIPTERIESLSPRTRLTCQANHELVWHRADQT